MAIYVHKNGQQLGPFEDDAVRSQLLSGQLSPGDTAIRQGDANWSTLAALFPGVTQAAAAPAAVSMAAAVVSQSPAAAPAKKGGCLKVGLIVVGILMFLGGLAAGVGSRFIPSVSCSLADSDQKEIVKLQADLDKAKRDADTVKISSIERELDGVLAGAKTSQEYCDQERLRNNIIGISGGVVGFVGVLFMLIGLIVGRKK